jgi:prepilin-type N-terminal cleavage/methylation domain-containing protein
MSLLEVLMVLAVMGIALGAAGLYLRPMEAPLEVAATDLEGIMRQSRARALATTSAYRVSAVSNRVARGEFAANCAATTWTGDPDLVVELPREVTMTDTSWSVCFNSRGLSDANVVLTVTHPVSGSLRIEVLRGGAARVLE